MAAVFKSILIATALLLFGFGMARAVRSKPEACPKYGRGPVVLEQVWVDEAKRTVPVRLPRAQYPRLYSTGYVPGNSGPCSGANVGQIGDFWAGMNRSTIRNSSQDSQTRVSPRSVSGEKAK